MKAAINIVNLLFAFFLLGNQPLGAQEGLQINHPLKEAGFLPKTSYGFQSGSTFSTGFSGNYLFSQSLAPYFQWNPGQRFRLEIGTLFSTSHFSGDSGFSLFGLSPSNHTGTAVPPRLFSNTIYAFGTYQLNERLTLAGGSWIEKNNFGDFQSLMNPLANGLNSRGVMMGLDYWISENVHFGAQFNVSKGKNFFSPLTPAGALNRVLLPTVPFQRYPFW